MWYLAPYTFTIRHSITALFSLGVIFGVLLSFISKPLKLVFIFIMIFYFFLGLVSSLQQAIRFKKLFHFFTLPLCFFLYHFLHGIGVLTGILKLIFKVSPVQNIK